MNVNKVNKHISDTFSRYQIKDSLKLVDTYEDEKYKVLIWEINNTKCYRVYPIDKIEECVQFFIDGYVIAKLSSYNRLII